MRQGSGRTRVGFGLGSQVCRAPSSNGLLLPYCAKRFATITTADGSRFRSWARLWRRAFQSGLALALPSFSRGRTRASYHPTTWPRPFLWLGALGWWPSARN